MAVSDAVSGDRVLYFDGVCGLCNFWVDFTLTHDRHASIFVSPLQSDYAARQLPAARIADLDTVVYQRGGELLTKSDAILTILSDLGGPFRIALIFQLIPRLARDWAYDQIARRRYRWFSRRDICRMPTPQERARFRVD